MNIIPVQTALAGEPSPTKAGDEFINELIAECLAERGTLLSVISDLTTRINNMLAEIDEQTATLRLAIREMLSEISYLQQHCVAETLQNAPAIEQIYTSSEQSSEQEWGYYDADYDADVLLNNISENPEVVKLFKKIAFKTHPDRTDDTELHLLFIVAKEHRANGNLDGLMEIWDFITGKTNVLLPKLQKRLDEVRAELNMLQRQLAAIRTGIDYTLYKLYTQNSSEVLRAVYSQTLARHDKLYSHLAMLRSVMGVPKPESKIDPRVAGMLQGL